MQDRGTDVIGELQRARSSGIGAHASSREPVGLRRIPNEGWERHLALSRIVRSEVIPRLVIRRSPSATDAATSAPAPPDAEHVAEFVRLAIAPDVMPFLEDFDQIVAKGHSPDRLFLSLLAPAACLLGKLWEEDLCTFVDVTLGVGRLQALISGFRPDKPQAADERGRVFLTGAPGEQHTLGLAIVEHFMREAGWQISTSPASTPEELRELLGREWFGVIGLALSSETRIEQLAGAIRAVRQWSCNKAIGIMVGGPIFLLRPELTAYVGADASAVDGPTAVLLARKLLDIQ